jgi:uncharacterized membrane protein (GlpM family)
MLYNVFIVNVLNLVMQFVVAGSVVVGATVLAKHVDPKWSGLLVALPIMTIVALLFIQIGASQEDVQKYLKSALIFMIPAAIYIASILAINQKAGTIISLFIAIVPFILAVYAVQKLI